MENNLNKILNNKLFIGMSKANASSMLACLGAHEKKHKKNEIIINEGDSINFVGMVIKGKVKIVKSDYNGNETIFAEISEGDIFAEVFACAEVYNSPVSIVAVADSLIVYFDYKKIISTCRSSCEFHQRLISNMFKILANKSLYLNRRIEVISKRSLRDKVLTFLFYESGGLNKFNISLNREQLANFLCADRSALSNELSKLKKEGIINYQKNEFELLY